MLGRVVQALLLTGVATLVILASCGPSVIYREGGAAGDRPNIVTGDDAGNVKTLQDLTLNERRELCDWSNGILGGYGKITMCEAGLVMNQRNQEQCIIEYPACYATVDQWIECQKKIATDICALY